MITTYDVKRAFEHAKKKNSQTWCYYDEKEDCIRNTQDDSYICKLETFVQHMREKHHCDFECIYSEHATLETIYRCKECGTVIFAGDDDYRFDPNLECPTCGGYKTHLTYWTKEEIEGDPEKQKTIDLYIQWDKEQREAYQRRERRGGLYDWEIWDKKFYFKNKSVMYQLTLECHDWPKRNLKGLNLEVQVYRKNKPDDCFLTGKKFFRIPLSPYAFYLQFILPYKKSTPSEIRKYLPWQKKPNSDKKISECI